MPEQTVYANGFEAREALRRCGFVLQGRWRSLTHEALIQYYPSKTVVNIWRIVPCIDLVR